VTVPVAGLHATEDGAALDRQVLFGAEVTELESRGGRAFVRDAAMGHVGWVAQDALGPPRRATHRVAVRSTLRFAAPDFKAPSPVALPFGVRLDVAGTEGRYAALAGGGFVIAEHLAPLAEPPCGGDPVACAALHLGAPYLWGGNSAFGIDCSGLVQVALSACGHPCPGDSDQQEAALGATMPPDTPPRRGDLLFWAGHVAWVAGGDTLLHANAHHMAVAQEPLAGAVARIAAQGGGPVTRHARLA
jgi:cell wall-associated NlpC family hydrolase